MAGITEAAIRENRRSLDTSMRAFAAATNLSGTDRQVLGEIGNDVVNIVKAYLSGPSPSEPGEPPGVVTGRLRASYSYELDLRDPGRPAVLIGSGVEYAPYLEFGTRYMEPRPHLRPAVEDAITLMSARFIRAMTAKAR